jgi:16S rRNA (guanine966-N2)-methyltransferase
VTRIVAGLAKGRRLVVPERGTRPTSERAREALFNTLRTHLDIGGANVLDLFAGTGAVGLEALSRGAGRVVFVERDRTAAALLQRNIDAVGLPGTRVHRRAVTAVLDDPAGNRFDLVFADPPYELPDDQLGDILTALVTGDWLVPDAMVVVERSARGNELAWPPGIVLVTHRRYGEGQLWYGRANHG